MKNIIDVVKISRTGEDNRFLKVEFIKDYDDTLDNLYKDVDCRTIDIITRGIEGKPFNIVCDDEALLNGKAENNLPTAIFEEPMGEQLYGNLLITGLGDNEGNLTGLTEEDYKLIKRACGTLGRLANLETGKEVLFQCLLYTRY